MKNETVPEQKLCGMLGLAKKAGKLVVGTPLVTETVRRTTKDQPLLVLLASDASANTMKRIRNCCAYYQRDYLLLPINTETLAHIIGKHSFVSAVGITDNGFITAIKKTMETKMEDVE